MTIPEMLHRKMRAGLTDRDALAMLAMARASGRMRLRDFSDALDIEPHTAIKLLSRLERLALARYESTTQGRQRVAYCYPTEHGAKITRWILGEGPDPFRNTAPAEINPPRRHRQKPAAFLSPARL